MILIDTNALIVLLIGFIDPKLFANHKRVSIYDVDDFEALVTIIKNVDQLVVLPNIWTEVDNLLKDFSGSYKYPYIENLTNVIKASTEKYIASSIAISNDYFFELGLTDSLILEHAKECKLLITSDSRLSDFAKANGIEVYDLVKVKNDRL